MPSAQTHPTHRYFLWLALIMILAASAIALRWSFPVSTNSHLSSNEQVAPVTFSQDAPAPTARDYVAQQKGFQYLVLYTSNGFVPATLAVKQGETVRFTNNADGALQLSLASATALARGQYFEYTFDKAGTFTLSSGANAMTVTVK